MYYEMLQDIASSGMTKNAGMEKQAYKMLKNMARSGMTNITDTFFGTMPINLLSSSLAGGLIGAGLNSEDPAIGAALGAGIAPIATTSSSSIMYNRDYLKNGLKNLFKRGKGRSAKANLLKVLRDIPYIDAPVEGSIFSVIPAAAAYGLGKLYENFREKENKE